MRAAVKLLALAAPALGSAAAMAWAVRGQRPVLATAAAMAFAVPLVVVSLVINGRYWRPVDDACMAAVIDVGATNAALIALAYAWGAASLTFIYTLSGLRWQHGLQYAAGMAVLAGLIAAYGWAMHRRDSRLRPSNGFSAMLHLALLHAAAAAIGVGFLIASGKLHSSKGDWAANIVFLVGGLTVVILNVIAAATHVRLTHFSVSGRGRRQRGD